MTRKKTPAQNSGVTAEKHPKRGRAENIVEHQFKPGQSGNPGGRPKKGILTDVIEAMANELVPGDPHGRTFKRVVAERLYAEAIKGKVQAASEIMDRVEGKPLERVDVALSLPEDDPKDKLRAFLAQIRPAKTKSGKAG